MKEKISRRRFLTQSALAAVALPMTAPAREISDARFFDKETSSRRSLVLWYDQPASEWVEALAVGNGRLGAMVFGRTKNERLQLNEDTSLLVDLTIPAIQKRCKS
jgi:alpha-L-fucosidase 2